MSGGSGSGLLAAGADAGGRLASETLPWLGLFALAIVLLWLAAVWLKRRIAGNSGGKAGAFAPETLERLRRDGALSEEQLRAISRAQARHAAGLDSDSDGPREPTR